MMRLAAVVSALLLLSAGPPALSDEKAPISDRSAVEKIVRDYLLNNPEVVIEALESYKRNQEKLKEDSVRQTIAERRSEIYEDPHSVVAGNPKGDVTLVEFFDYRCGVCKRVHPIVEEVMKRDNGIRRVYKEWPILGPASVYASKAAIAARRQGDEKYLAFHDALMESRGTLQQSTVLKIAASVGLDTKRLEADLMAPEVERVIKRNFDLAKALRLNGTPSFVIGDTVLRGGRDVDTLLSIVRKERDEKG